jgi:hypothetical protein
VVGLDRSYYFRAGKSTRLRIRTGLLFSLPTPVGVDPPPRSIVQRYVIEELDCALVRQPNANKVPSLPQEGSTASQGLTKSGRSILIWPAVS